MAIVYIDSNASGLNDGTSWTDAYDGLLSATTAGVASNDVIYMASNHSFEHFAGVQFNLPQFVNIFSVNSTTSAYEKALNKQEYSSTNALYIRFSMPDSSVIGMAGLSISALKDDLFLSYNSEGSTFGYSECIFDVSGWATNLFFGEYQDTVNKFVLNDCTLLSSDFSGGAHFYVYGGVLEINGGAINGYSIFKFSNSSLAAVNLNGVDLSAVKENLFDIDGVRKQCLANLSRCKMPAIFANNEIGMLDISVSESSSSSGYHYFYKSNSLGVIEENIAAYLAATYDGTNGFSADIASNANTGIGAPLRYKLCTIPALDLTANKTFKVNFTSATALTDADFWVEAVRPDGTSQALGVTDSARSTDILNGVIHTINAEAWTGGLANTYDQSITITGMAGVTNANVDIYVNLALANTDVIVCPSVVVS